MLLVPVEKKKDSRTVTADSFQHLREGGRTEPKFFRLRVSGTPVGSGVQRISRLVGLLRILAAPYRSGRRVAVVEAAFGKCESLAPIRSVADLARQWWTFAVCCLGDVEEVWCSIWAGGNCLGGFSVC